MSDPRRRVRIGLEKHAMAKGEHKAFEGRLEDISANGASMVFTGAMPGDAAPFKRGDSIEIVVDNLSSLTGWVIRCDQQSAAIEFTHDNEGEEQLIAEIMDSM